MQGGGETAPTPPWAKRGHLRLFLMAQTQFLLLLLIHGSHGELPQTQI